MQKWRYGHNLWLYFRPTAVKVLIGFYPDSLGKKFFTLLSTKATCVSGSHLYPEVQSLCLTQINHSNQINLKTGLDDILSINQIEHSDVIETWKLEDDRSHYFSGTTARASLSSRSWSGSAAAAPPARPPWPTRSSRWVKQGCGCSTATKDTPHNLEVVGSNPAKVLGFCLLFLLSISSYFPSPVESMRSLVEVHWLTVCCEKIENMDKNGCLAMLPEAKQAQIGLNHQDESN